VSAVRRRPARLPPERAWDYALGLLGRQAYSAAELGRRLVRRGLAQAETDRVIARLQELSLLDDARYAEAFVRSRRGAKGTLALRRELGRKGVADHHVEAALGEAGEPDQLAAALAVLDTHAWRFADAAGDDPDAARRARARAAAFLARRGFAPDDVAAALERAWPDPGSSRG
jgi:regulatory protein